MQNFSVMGRIWTDIPQTVLSEKFYFIFLNIYCTLTYHPFDGKHKIHNMSFDDPRNLVSFIRIGRASRFLFFFSLTRSIN